MSPPRPRPIVAVLVLPLLLALVLAACSGTEAPRPDVTTGPTPSRTTAETPRDPAASPVAMATQAEVARVIGRLPGTRRKAVRKQVTAVIDRWWERAYLPADGARIKVADAFPGFTPGAKRRARFDRRLMTNAALAADSATPLMRKVRLDLLAVDRRARSVTARFDLRMRTTGARAGRLRINGRLFLIKRPAGWRVFGYDVSKAWL